MVIYSTSINVTSSTSHHSYYPYPLAVHVSLLHFTLLTFDFATWKSSINNSTTTTTMASMESSTELPFSSSLGNLCPVHRRIGFCEQFPCPFYVAMGSAVSLVPSSTALQDRYSPAEVLTATDEEPPFWRLAYELREEIYSLVLCSEPKLRLATKGGKLVLNAEDAVRKNLLALTAVCRKMQSETTALVSTPLQKLDL